MFCPSTGALNRRSWGVWPSAGRFCTFRRWQQHSIASAHQLSWSPDWTNVDLTWFQSARRKLLVNSMWISDFLQGVRFFEDFSTSPELIWFSMDYFDARSCTTTAYLWCILDSWSSLRTLWSAVPKSPKSCGYVNSVCPNVRTSCAWRYRNFRASAYFAIRVFSENEWINCFPPASVRSRFCWSMRGRRKCWRWFFHASWRPIQTILANLFKLLTRGHPRVVSPSGLQEHGSGDRLLAHENVAVASTFDVSPILDEIWWLTWMPFIRVIDFFAQKTQRESTAGDSLRHWTSTNMFKSQKFIVASSVVWVVPFAVLVQCPRWFPCHFSHAQGPFDGSFSECWSVWFSLISRSCLDDSKCKSQFFLFLNKTVREMMESDSALSLVIQLYCLCTSVCCSSFAVMWIATVAAFFFSSAVLAACVRTFVSETASTWSFEFCTFGNMPIITLLSFREVLYKVVCSLSLTHFHQ